MVDRDNETWVADLSGQNGKQRQEAALQDLGNILLPLMRWYLCQRPESLHDDLDLGALAQDIVQDSLVSIWQKGLKLYRGEARFLNFAKAIAINQARQKLRQRWRHREEPGSWFEREDGDEEDDDGLPVRAAAEPVWGAAEWPAEQRLVLKQALQCVDRALKERCSPRERQAFMLKYLDGLPAAEIARWMKTTDRAVNLLTYMARQKLMQALEEQGLTWATLWSYLDR